MIRPGPELETSILRQTEPRSLTPAGIAPASTAQAVADMRLALDRVAIGKGTLAKMPLRRRIELVEQCIHGVAGVAREWVDIACQAKGLPANHRSRAEEVLGGPVSTLRQIQLFLRSMRDIEREGSPRLPKVVRHPSGQRFGVRVTPCGGLFDPLVFVNFNATTWLEPGVDPRQATDCLAPAYRDLSRSGLSVVLGAGNVSGIPATDMLTKVCMENRAVLLKMNPVNDYLVPVFERAFAPLIENDVLRVVRGDAQVASLALHDPRVDDVHITGSAATHEAIVWGPAGEDCERRRLENDPVLTKPISSELGNVTPWVVIPGRYAGATLKAQAENIVSSLTNNAAFNCIATRVIVTWKQWPDRERFLQLIESSLARMPQRVAYYPGASARYERFTGTSLPAARSLLRASNLSAASVSGCQTRGDGSMMFVAGTNGRDDTLPWTLIRNVNPRERSLLFEEESFASICAEVPIDASSPEDFLNKAVEFANEQLWGTLAISLTVPGDFRRRASGAAAFQEALDRLRYGTVCVNQWAGLAFGLMSIPWGGYAGSTLWDPQSGSGFVHNSYMLTGIEKTVLEGPAIVLPKPVWVPSHQRPESVAWALMELFKNPSWWNANRLTVIAIRGALARQP